MPNWCYDDTTIFSSDNNLDLLNKLKEDLKDAFSEQPTKFITKNIDTDRYWLGNILLTNIDYYSEEFKKYYPRGTVVYIDLDEEDCIHLVYEHAWSPWINEFKTYLDKYYTGLTLVGLCEEPGEAIYINTDTTGKYYTAKYLLESDIECTICETDKEVIDFVNNFYIEESEPKLNTIEEVLNFANKYTEEHENKNDFTYINIYKYTLN